ncbi:hypothetical protein [Alteribacter natronophilus]|uniref:hypothetical protein n=1 Tax=Alteribacter natronophilus TaxID=2583810 RepID=UPI00110E2B3D|nr:hypothetical protein [Alteribacter natronophilus]TMW70701.1 hypothetical protein FGB90_16090 [Alteribacter natronophilus]
MYYTKEEIRMMLDHLSDEEISRVYNYITDMKSSGRMERSMDGSGRKNRHSADESMDNQSSRMETD